MSELTEILCKVEGGDSASAAELLPLIYEELKKLAAEKLSHESPGQTLQATALVHEAWMRMVDVDYEQRWKSRRHFFAAAAEAMRRILVDRARKKNRLKHGADWQRIDIDLQNVGFTNNYETLEEIDDALYRLEKVDRVACELVKLRYFAGLTLLEAGQALELAPRSADRLWSFAKAWLLREIQNGIESSS